MFFEGVSRLAGRDRVGLNAKSLRGALVAVETPRAKLG